VGQRGPSKSRGLYFFHQLGIGFLVHHRIVSAVDSRVC